MAHNPGGFQTGNNFQRQCEILPVILPPSVLMWLEQQLPAWMGCLDSVMASCAFWRIWYNQKQHQCCRSLYSRGNDTVLAFKCAILLLDFFFSDTPNDFNSTVWKIGIFDLIDTVHSILKVNHVYLFLHMLNF